MGVILRRTRESRIESAVTLAAALLNESLKESKRSEKKKMKALAKMVNDPQGISFVTSLADQCFRSHHDERTANQLLFLIDQFSLPKFLSLEEKLSFLLFQHFGTKFPSYFVPKVKKKIFHEMSRFFRHGKERGTLLNLNHLGEAVLGEKEALRRLELYLKDFDDAEVDAISIKISTLTSQINLVGWHHTLEILKERLRVLYRACHGKLVTLDMEEYKDFDLTLTLFKEVLSEEEFSGLTAGIVLQSYLPNSFAAQKELTTWASQRKAPIRIRLVKGANLAMEKVESSLRGWPQAPFEKKVETDANYLRMLEFGLEKKNAKAAYIGVGSHNLFDVAYALLLSQENGVTDSVTFEMLQGMAEPIQRALQKRIGTLLLYTPEVSEKEFPYAAPYLIRRLDENSGPENFLRHLFELKLGSSAWNSERARFKESAELIDTLPQTPRRVQNRLEESVEKFDNEPDTDFSLPQNRKWVEKIYQEWQHRTVPQIPLVDKVEKVFHVAKMWDIPIAERSRILAQVTDILKKKRGEFIGAMMAESSKVFEEADVEVSEAIDFVEYYRHEGEEIFTSSHLQWSPKGILLVAPPWNFPVSIPVGGLSAALMAGNSVLFKPAPETRFIASLIVEAFWEAGVPRESLQFVPCDDDPTGSELISDHRLNGVILTGSTETAKHLLTLHPGLDLMAETGGKNAMIITAMADRDLALSDLLKSAFGHAGQKCSACSLAILEAELYDDPSFLQQLKDAASSMVVGPSLNPATKIPPLIRAHDPTHFTLDEGEEWLLEPKQSRENPLLYSPGIKMNVKKGSRTHQTEFFAPILGVMRADHLTHAIELANSTPYGLTSGLHSLDVREHEIWKKTIVAGNLYINRTITGAIVRRQPFGGTKSSSFGPGAKAGGPNYLAQMAHPSQRTLPKAEAPLPPTLIPLINALGLNDEEMTIWKASSGNYVYWAKKLKTPEDVTQVLGQDNFFYLVPHDKITLRLREGDSRLDILRVCAACLVCETPLEISSEEKLFDHPQITWKIEERKNFLSRVEKGHVKRIRLLHTPSQQLKEKAAVGFGHITATAVLASGRYELLHYMREVSLSVNTHRYGYLGISK